MLREGDMDRERNLGLEVLGDREPHLENTLDGEHEPRDTTNELLSGFEQQPMKETNDSEKHPVENFNLNNKFTVNVS